MKTAFSILLGEYVGAPAVEHADTGAFQIVCPCCKDPVFKVSRESRVGQSDFFSHHQRPKDLVAECELRVASISGAEQERSNAASRGQTLKAFQKVLRDALLLDDGIYAAHTDVERFHSDLRAHHGLGYFLDIQAHSFLGGGEMQQRGERFADIYLQTLAQSGMEMQTSFSTGVQRRIALDLVGHLGAPHSERSRRFLCAHTYITERQNFRSMIGSSFEQDSRTKPMIGFYRRIEGMDGFKLRNWMMSMPQEDLGAITLSFKVSMVGALMRLPYWEMLANHNAGRPMLQGIARGDDALRMGLKRSDGGTQYTIGDLQDQAASGPR